MIVSHGCGNHDDGSYSWSKGRELRTPTLYLCLVHTHAHTNPIRLVGLDQKDGTQLVTHPILKCLHLAEALRSIPIMPL